MKFKAGDKVRCVKSTMAVGVNIGDVYTIKGLHHISEFGFHITLEEVQSTPTEDVFELVEPNPKFKVGDKVRCVDRVSTQYIKLGEVYTVKRVTENRFLKLVEIAFPHTYSPTRFELVQEDAVLTPEEVFEHLRKGTKLQYRRLTTLGWSEGNLANPSFKMITLGEWRIKPEPEVIEVNGKKYREITD